MSGFPYLLVDSQFSGRLIRASWVAENNLVNAWSFKFGVDNLKSSSFAVESKRDVSGFSNFGVVPGTKKVTCYKNVLFRSFMSLEIGYIVMLDVIGKILLFIEKIFWMFIYFKSIGLYCTKKYITKYFEHFLGCLLSINLIS